MRSWFDDEKGDAEESSLTGGGGGPVLAALVLPVEDTKYEDGICVPIIQNKYNESIQH